MNIRLERTPKSLLLFAWVAASFLSLPTIYVMVRIPWSNFVEHLMLSELRETFFLSIYTSIASTLASLLFGLPLAVLLANARGKWVSALRVLTLLPIVLPPVVAGVALLLVFGRNGIVGEFLWQAFEFQIPFTPIAVVLAQTFVSMPFLVITLESALRGIDHDLSDAAASAGASRFQTLRMVTLPTINQSILAAITLAWARAFGEFGATITFAGSFPGRTQTLPISVYLALESNLEDAIILSALMIATSTIVLVVLRSRWLYKDY